MKFILLFFFAFIGGFISFSQPNNHQQEDSLQRAFKSSQDINTKFQVLSKLGELYLKEMDYENAERTATQILSLSQKKNIQFNSTAYHLLGRIYLRNNQVKEGEKVYLLSIKEIKEAKGNNKEKLAWQMYNYGNFLKNVGDYQQAISFFDKSYTIQKELGNLSQQGDCLLNSGAMYLYLGKNDRAEELLKRAYKIALRVKDTSSLNTITTNMASVYEIKGDYAEALHQLDLSENYASTSFDLAYIYGNRGNLYFYLGKIDSAIYAYQKSSEYFIESGRMLENGMVLMELGVIFKNQKKYNQAFKLFNESENVFKNSENDDLLTAVLINKGETFKEVNQLDSAFYNFQTALTFANKTGNTNYLGICNQSIGLLLIKKKDFKNALEHMNNALLYFSEMNDQRLLGEVYSSLADIYIQLKNYPQAEKYLNKAFTIIESLDNLTLKTAIFDNYVKLNSYRFNVPKIYYYHTEQIRLLDSLRSETNSTVVEDLYAQYHLKETEDSLKISRLNTEKQLIISQEKEKQLTFSIIGLIIFSILLVIVIISRKKVKEKNKENELLLGEIHHRVKNNLQVISSLLSLQERNITDKTAKAAIIEGKERVQSMGLIHKLLYQKNRFSGIDMNEYVQKLIDGLLDSFGKSKDEMELDIDFKRINLDVDTAVPIGLILNELVINCLKYAYEGIDKPSLSIKIKEENEQLILQVEDNGVGEVSNVLEAKSFGMKLIRSLSKQISGVLEVEKHVGLCFRIRINDYKTVN